MKRQDHFDEAAARHIIHTEASRCVKCALCAPVCPTYQLTKNESESPRGRIALAEGLVNHQIPLTDITRTHLDHCLSCLACEAVCPVGVQYGKLFDASQAHIEASAPKPFHLKENFIKALPNLLGSQSLLALLRFYPGSGLQKILRTLNFFGWQALKQQDAILPPLSKPLPFKKFYPVQGAERGQVGLFLGCANKALDPTTLRDAITVLTAIGYAVHVPLKQTCCGALDLHAGRQKAYQGYRQKNKNVFEPLKNKPLSAIVSIASGCSVVLSDYLTPVCDISDFINRHWNEAVRLKPYPHEVWLHTPCTLKNFFKSEAALEQLLRRIPELQLKKIPIEVGCCGAAGSHFLQYPKEADALLSKTLDILRGPAKIILTANIGCQLQLQHGLRAENNASKIYHPLSLLAGLLIFKT